jgi:hypothetical protein
MRRLAAISSTVTPPARHLRIRFSSSIVAPSGESGGASLRCVHRACPVLRFLPSLHAAAR